MINFRPKSAPYSLSRLFSLYNVPHTHFLFSRTKQIVVHLLAHATTAVTSVATRLVYMKDILSTPSSAQTHMHTYTYTSQKRELYPASVSFLSFSFSAPPPPRSSTKSFFLHHRFFLRPLPSTIPEYRHNGFFYALVKTRGRTRYKQHESHRYMECDTSNR
jgi:hypothetical protein